MCGSGGVTNTNGAREATVWFGLSCTRSDQRYAEDGLMLGFFVCLSV